MTISDRSTCEKRRQYSTGVKYVPVTGGQQQKNGEHIGQKSGRAVRGPGWKPRT